MIRKLLCELGLHEFELHLKYHYLHSYETNGFTESRKRKVVYDNIVQKCRYCGKEEIVC